MARDLVLELRATRSAARTSSASMTTGGTPSSCSSPRSAARARSRSRTSGRPRSGSRATSTTSCCASQPLPRHPAPGDGGLRPRLLQPPRHAGAARVAARGGGLVLRARPARAARPAEPLRPAEVLLADQLTTVFQPIVRLEPRRRRVLGYEALSRGPAGSVYQMPSACSTWPRRRTSSSSSTASAAGVRWPPGPCSGGGEALRERVPVGDVRPEFRARPSFTSPRGTASPPTGWSSRSRSGPPSRNCEVFSEALAELTQFGFSIAVDDVGTGYSGLEKIAHLNPRYLKFDRELIHNIDSSYIRREMTRALKAFADRIGSTIIARASRRKASSRRSSTSKSSTARDTSWAGRRGRSCPPPWPPRPPPPRASEPGVQCAG